VKGGAKNHESRMLSPFREKEKGTRRSEEPAAQSTTEKEPPLRKENAGMRDKTVEKSRWTSEVTGSRPDPWGGRGKLGKKGARLLFGDWGKKNSDVTPNMEGAENYTRKQTGGETRKGRQKNLKKKSRAT